MTLYHKWPNGVSNLASPMPSNFSCLFLRVISLCQKHLCVIGTIGLNFLVVLDDVTADALSGKGITVAEGGAD